MIRTSYKNQKGYSIIEMLAALAIVSALVGMSLFTYGSNRRQRDLDADLSKLMDAVNQARFGTMTSASAWLVTIDCSACGSGRVAFGADDGWIGTTVGVLGFRVGRRDYYLGNPDFDESQRGDGILNEFETVSTFRFSPMVRVLDSPADGIDCPPTISFNPDTGIDTMNILWLADEVVDPALANGFQKNWTRPLVILPSGAVHLPRG